MAPFYRTLCAASLLCLAAQGACAGDLALKRVMLSTGGVGYFEYEAEVEGDAKLTLDVRLDQVDDVLKSVVVYDDKGGVGSASLPGRSPLGQIFADLPFPQGALESPAALLNTLQGAEIHVEGNRPLTGKLVRVVTETERVGEQGMIARNRVSVLSKAGIQQFVLENADSIVFTDPELEAAVEKALDAIASHRAKDRREIDLMSRGTGKRLVRIGYVAAAPLWKATYRVTLPQDLAAEKAPLQGWAVLENMSGQDWKDVELTLLSGNPVSFRQAIYEAYYVTRPEVPVEVAGRILPRVDSGTVPLAAESAATLQPQNGPAGIGGGFAAVARSSALAGAPGRDDLDRMRGADVLKQATSVETAQAQEAMTQVAFRIPVPVTIASGRSAFVAIADRKIPAERLALMQAGTSSEHPLASVRLTNDEGSGLPPGVVTLYEETAEGPAYVGDARLGGLPAGESRLLSYAVDDKTKVVREQRSTSELTKVSISQGVLHLVSMERQTIVFRLAAPAKEPRKVIIEQPKFPGWELVEPALKSVEETAQAYRSTEALKPGEGRAVTFVLEYPRLETTAVAGFGDQRIAAVVATRAIDPKVKTALAELQRLRREAAERKSAQSDLARQLGTVTTDQSRLRSNLESVDRESALYRRYMDKLAAEETQIEKLQDAVDQATEAVRAADAAVDAYIQKLEI